MLSANIRPFKETINKIILFRKYLILATNNARNPSLDYDITDPGISI
ncbi:hypothetical protein MCAMS1_02598 [biofilm metagenome]